MVLHFGSTRLKISFAIQSRVKEWYILRVFLGKMQESCSMIAPIELFLIFSVWASSGSSYLWNLARPPSCLIMSAIVRFSLLFLPNSFQWEHTKSVYYNRPLSTKIAIRIAATDFPELNTWVKLSGPYPSYGGLVSPDRSTTTLPSTYTQSWDPVSCPLVKYDYRRSRTGLKRVSMKPWRPLLKFVDYI